MTKMLECECLENCVIDGGTGVLINETFINTQYLWLK